MAVEVYFADHLNLIEITGGRILFSRDSVGV